MNVECSSQQCIRLGRVYRDRSRYLLLIVGISTLLNGGPRKIVTVDKQIYGGTSRVGSRISDHVLLRFDHSDSGSVS